MGLACKDGDFDNNDARLAGAFGDYAAIALKNSQTFEKLKHTIEVKDKFFSIIAHDLRSPFSSFLGMLEEIYIDFENYSSDEMYSFISAMQKSVNKLYRLVENLLEWSQLNRGKITLNPESIDLFELANDIKGHFSSSLRMKKIKLELSNFEGFEILADRRLLESILRNLISNAIKFSHEESIVSVSARMGDDSILMISVRDMGIGMSQDIQNKLFKHNENVSRKGTNGELSTGLGLLLCYEFVKLHNGNISVDSEEGKGTTVYFTLSES